MTDHRPPPPEAEACLTRSRTSRYKGGTLIAEDVLDIATHEERIRSPDGYRLDACARCGCRVLHVHDYRERMPRGEPGWPPVVTVVRYICADAACKATWRVLPAFLARHLWRVWPTAERTVSPPPGIDAAPVPERTAQRWRQRLATRARQLVILLATNGGAMLEEMAKRAGLDATRFSLLEVYTQETRTPIGRRLGDLASLLHRLERGLRLM